MAGQEPAVPHAFYADRQLADEHGLFCLRDLTVDVVRNGSYTSVKESGYAITNGFAERTLNPTRFEWRDDLGETLTKIMRAREKAGIVV